MFYHAILCNINKKKTPTGDGDKISNQLLGNISSINKKKTPIGDENLVNSTYHLQYTNK